MYQAKLSKIFKLSTVVMSRIAIQVSRVYIQSFFVFTTTLSLTNTSGTFLLSYKNIILGILYGNPRQ